MKKENQKPAKFIVYLYSPNYTTFAELNKKKDLYNLPIAKDVYRLSIIKKDNRRISHEIYFGNILSEKGVKKVLVNDITHLKNCLNLMSLGQQCLLLADKKSVITISPHTIVLDPSTLNDNFLKPNELNLSEISFKQY